MLSVINNDLLLDIYNLLSQNDDFTKSLSRIRKYISIYEGTDWAKQVFSFVEFEILKRRDIDFQKLRQINSNRNNPLFYKAMPTRESSISFLELLEKNKTFNVISLFTLIEKANNSSDLVALNALGIPKYRKLFYTAVGLEKINLKIDAIKIYENILTSFPNKFVLYHETLYNLLNCYYSLGDYNAYLKLYVLNSFNNINLKIVPKDIHRKIESLRFIGIEKSIFLPIFYFLTSPNTHLINLTIRHFLKSYDCIVPTEIIKYKDNFQQHHLIFFLRHICTQENLKFFTYFKGTKEILNERLGICRILLTLDKDNEKVYNNEIGLIAKSIVIIEGLKQVDESKIFVDEKGIRTNELKDFKNLFERYLSILELLGDRNIMIVDLKSLKSILAKLTDEKHNEEDIGNSTGTVNIKFGYFKDLFLIVRDKFLFNSKYGLDTYLSTRIRHGTLLGQIRRRFQDYHLITQKDKDEDVYFENEYWTNKIFTAGTMNKDLFIDYLSKFSKKIDTLTNELKNELIQIRTESKINHGLFDYIYPDSVLLNLFSNEYQEIRNYEQFVDQIFKNLWTQTNHNLSLIRDYIGSTIKEQYLTYFKELENELKSLNIDTQSFQELINDIVSCKTNISWELDKIANWFQIKETDVQDFTIDKAIDTSMEITNRISESVKIINIEKNIKSQTIIKGSNFISYFDLLRIFFDNTSKYSENSSENLKVKITAIEEGDFLIIKITNNLYDTSFENIARIKQIFVQKSKDLNNPDWDMEKIKKEGNTGFYKAKKILVSDLHSEKNNFDFSINNNNEIEIKISISLN
jgi:hypothetical protein